MFLAPAVEQLLLLEELWHLLEVSILARLLVAGTSASLLFVLLAAVLGLIGMVAKVDFHMIKTHPGFCHRFHKQCTAIQIKNSPLSTV